MSGFMAGVFDVLKTAEHNQNSAIRPEQEPRQFIRLGTGDNSPYIQEPDEAKVSCPVLYRRWGGQPPHRPKFSPRSPRRKTKGFKYPC